ncbi:MAG: AraC family ligand binding domain-containing protein [Myxococcota bacterium]
MPLYVADIGLHLLSPPEDAPETGLLGVADGAGASWSLLRVAPDDETEVAATEAGLSLLVLDGVATFAVEDGRESLGSGHLLLVEPGRVVTVTNEGEAPLRALVALHPETAEEAP